MLPNAVLGISVSYLAFVLALSMSDRRPLSFRMTSSSALRSTRIPLLIPRCPLPCSSSSQHPLGAQVVQSSSNSPYPPTTPVPHSHPTPRNHQHQREPRPQHINVCPALPLSLPLPH